MEKIKYNIVTWKICSLLVGVCYNLYIYEKRGKKIKNTLQRCNILVNTFHKLQQVYRVYNYKGNVIKNKIYFFLAFIIIGIVYG